MFANGYITNGTAAASAIHDAMGLLATAQAENKRLREALEAIIADAECGVCEIDVIELARAALKETADD